MKNLKIRRAALLMSASVMLVGCQNKNHNTYENQPVTKLETTQEMETTKVEVITTKESTTLFPETTVQEENTTMENAMTDEEVINYIRNLGDEMTSCSEAITLSMESRFITVVDFLFYGGEIGGRTFDSLKDDTKSTVLGVYNTISNYLEKNWPLWIEGLGEKYGQATKLWNEKKEELSDLWENGKQKVKGWYENFSEGNQQ